MDLKSLNRAQQEALLDLLVLGMYSDHHLASSEDVRLQSVLVAMGVSEQSDREKCLDESVTRTRQHSATAAGRTDYIHQLARKFADRDSRHAVSAALDSLVLSDHKVTDGERQFVTLVREAFAG